MARRRSPRGLGSLCCRAKALLGSLHTRARLWPWCCRALCPSTALLIPLERIRESKQGRARLHLTATGEILVTGPVAPSGSLSHSCSGAHQLKEEPSWLPSHSASAAVNNFLQQNESPSPSSAPATSAPQPLTAPAAAGTQGHWGLWSHTAQGLGNLAIPPSAPRTLAVGCRALPKCSTNPTGCPEHGDRAHLQPSIQRATAKPARV